jgi:thiamine kinase-like enzyme
VQQNADIEAQARLARVAALPIWDGPVDPEPLTGGITNHNFLVRDRRGRFVVRLGGDIPVHGISRVTERAASRAAHAAGVSPRVVHAEDGVLVIDHIEGRTFRPEDVRNRAHWQQLIALVRQAHERIPDFYRGPAPLFWVFQVVRDYAHSLADLESPYRPQLAGLLARAVDLERAVGPVALVFGHNDLLAANVLDDGRRLWLIDWDYAGFNSALFDLGGLASNSEVDRTGAEHMLELYFDRPVDDALRARAQAMLAASLLREAMWSMVSEQVSTLAFDYKAYTADYLARFDAAWVQFQEMRA